MEVAPWKPARKDKSFAWITEIPKEFEGNLSTLRYTKSLKSWFPEQLIVDLSPDHGIFLPDSIPNPYNWKFISERLKNVLEEELGDDIEFFPLQLRNKKGRIEKKTYYFAFYKPILDCVDMDRSQIDLSPINPEWASRIRRLAIDSRKVPQGTKIIRIKEYPELWLVNRELGTRIYRKEGFSGMLFTALEDYGKEWRN